MGRRSHRGEPAGSPRRQGADEEEEEGEEDFFDEDAPRVIIALAADLGSFIADEARRDRGQLPVWIYQERHDELVGVFERYPEAAGQSSGGDSVLAALRALSLSHNEPLQYLLGPTDGLRYGYHLEASLGEVVESFEDDGFEVLMALQDGHLDLGDL